MFKLADHSSKRISEIELMRFVAAFLILCCHMNGTTNYGWIAVEFFFILSGIMMAQSASKILAEKKEINIGIETKNMMVKKIKGFLPYFIICLSIYPLYYFFRDGTVYFAQDWDLLFVDAPEGMYFNLADGILNQIPDYFLMMMGGFYVENGLLNFATWFLSALVIGLLIVYPLYLWKKDTSRFVIMPLLFIFCIGILINTVPSLDVHVPWLTVTYAGILRAVGEIALGAFCYELCIRLKNTDLTKAGSALITVVKVLLVAVFLIWTFKGFPETRDFVMIFIIAAMLIIMYSEKGLCIPRGNRICIFLGTFSLPLFLLHSPIQRLFEDTYTQPWVWDHLYIV